jgi:hypothetical protein
MESWRAAPGEHDPSCFWRRRTDAPTRPRRPGRARPRCRRHADPERGRSGITSGRPAPGVGHREPHHPPAQRIRGTAHGGRPCGGRVEPGGDMDLECLPLGRPSRGVVRLDRRDRGSGGAPRPGRGNGIAITAGRSTGLPSIPTCRSSSPGTGRPSSIRAGLRRSTGSNQMASRGSRSPVTTGGSATGWEARMCRSVWWVANRGCERSVSRRPAARSSCADRAAASRATPAPARDPRPGHRDARSRPTAGRGCRGRRAASRSRSHGSWVPASR